LTKKILKNNLYVNGGVKVAEAPKAGMSQTDSLAFAIALKMKIFEALFPKVKSEGSLLLSPALVKIV
jgi:hypothetical protein